MPQRRLLRATAKTGRRLMAPARAVMRAFRSAKYAAPQFMSSCGIFPEVSESASDHLHPIVHDLAVKELDQDRHLRALQRRLRQLARTAGKLNRRDLLDDVNAELTAVLASQATAAYLFGLSVGLTVRSLPERID